MYTSIQQFNESGVVEIEEIVKRFTNNGEMNIGELITEMNKPIQELLCNIVAEIIEEIDKTYRDSEYRKQEYVIERTGVENSFISTCGQISYKRTYFRNKLTNELKYLADEACGITRNMRKSDDVVVESLNHVIDSSYRISGEHATQTDDVISKQAVMKDIHELDIPAYIPEIKKKKKVKALYVNADEDHVSLQFNQIKGDLKKDSNGRKINTVESRLVCIFEDIYPEHPQSKRKRLVNKHYVAGIYKDNENIWEEVLTYIDTVYDEEYLEKIYIMGDGAAWIKTGLDVLGAKSCFVLDKFHLNQSIMKAIGHMGDSVNDIRWAIYDAIQMEDLDEVKDILSNVSGFAETKGKIEQIRRTKIYITNHWGAIILPNSDSRARMGCSAEGQVSHLLSSRLSSRPLGWSIKGASNVSKLRVFVANGGNVVDLIKYKKDKVERKVKQEIIDEYDKRIRIKRKTYTDMWNRQSVATSIGRTDGMYYAFKSLRGICG